MTETRRIQIRRDTAANWVSNNPTMHSGELGLDETNGRVKCGDGSTAWTGLLYFEDNELAAIRLRLDALEGAHTTNGQAQLAFAFSISAIGNIIATRQVQVAIVIGVAASGSESTVVNGQAQLAIALSLAASGNRIAAGQVQIDYSINLAVSGSRIATGQAQLAINFSIYNSYTIRIVSRQAQMDIAFGISASGSRIVTGQAQGWYWVSVAASGVRIATGQAQVSISLSVAASGNLVTSYDTIGSSLMASSSYIFTQTSEPTGTLAYGSDTSDLYVWNGSNWVTYYLEVVPGVRTASATVGITVGVSASGTTAVTSYDSISPSLITLSSTIFANTSEATGTLAYGTDTSHFYVWNGSNWLIFNS